MNFCVSFINHNIYKPLGGSKFDAAFHSSEIDFILLGLFNRGDHFLITAGFGIRGVRPHMHASVHASNNRDMQKKHALFD